jgi:hypothetical protein
MAAGFLPQIPVFSKLFQTMAMEFSFRAVPALLRWLGVKSSKLLPPESPV